MLSGILGLLCGALAAWGYRFLPTKWLCDYNETPGAQHERSARCLPVWAIAAVAVVCGAAAYGMGAQLYTQLWCAPVLALLCAALALAAVCDIQYQILPDQLLAFAALAGLVLLPADGRSTVHGAWWMPLVSATVGFGAVCLVLWLAGKAYKTEAMGFGDVKLAGVAGLLCGLAGLATCVLTAVLSAALVFAVLALAKKADRRSLMAFGPFLVLGIFVALALWPQWHSLLAWYLSLF